MKEKNNEIQEILKEYNEDIKQHMNVLVAESERNTGALSEDFQSKLSAVAEGVTMLNKKVDRMEITLNSHTEMIGDLAEDVSILKEDVSEIKTELKNKVSRTEFLELKQTVLAMS